MRVVVVGTSGSGKSTFARRLAAAIGAQPLDRLTHPRQARPLIDRLAAEALSI